MNGREGKIEVFHSTELEMNKKSGNSTAAAAAKQQKRQRIKQKVSKQTPKIHKGNAHQNCYTHHQHMPKYGKRERERGREKTRKI